MALEDCANLYLLRAALDRTPQHVVNPQTFLSAINGLGSSYNPAGSLGNYLGAGRHDGRSVGYNWAYEH